MHEHQRIENLENAPAVFCVYMYKNCVVLYTMGEEETYSGDPPIQKRETVLGMGRWVSPLTPEMAQGLSGGRELGENDVDAVCREAKEETGLELRVDSIKSLSISDDALKTLQRRGEKWKLLIPKGFVYTLSGQEFETMKIFLEGKNQKIELYPIEYLEGEDVKFLPQIRPFTTALLHTLAKRSYEEIKGV